MYIIRHSICLEYIVIGFKSLYLSCILNSVHGLDWDEEESRAYGLGDRLSNVDDVDDLKVNLNTKHV